MTEAAEVQRADVAGNRANTWNPKAVVKSGWLWRQSSVLKRWKKSWFVLHMSGRFTYHEDQNSYAEDHVHIPAEKADFVCAESCDIQPPEGIDKSLLFGLKTEKKHWYLCAEDKDEQLAWQLSIEEARTLQPESFGNYHGWTPTTAPEGMRAVYPDQVEQAMKFGVYDPSRAPIVLNLAQGAVQLPPGSTLYLTQEGPVIVEQNGSQTLITNEGNCRYHQHDGSSFLWGAALGSMLVWPWLFWMPLFWW